MIYIYTLLQPNQVVISLSSNADKLAKFGNYITIRYGSDCRHIMRDNIAQKNRVKKKNIGAT